MKYQMLGGQCSLRNGNGQAGGRRRTKRGCGRRHEGQVGGQCGLRRNGNGQSGGRRTKRNSLRSKRTRKTKRINRRSTRRNSRKTKRGHGHPHNPNLKGGYAITIDEVKENK